MFYLFNIFIQMKILLNNKSLSDSLRPFNDIGFIPTMGGIHRGHLALINKSNQTCKKTVVSIFVNPKQFNSREDLKKYPSNLIKDLSLLRKSKKIDFVYLPHFNDIYEDKKKSKIVIKKQDKILCAKFRKGHFEGVLDVMSRLTKLVKPKKIFMGQKDFQQFYLVKRYLENRYKTVVILCKTIRDKNKVALSSRNYLLKKSELIIASKLSKEVSKLKKEINKQKSINKFLLIKKNEIQKILKIKIEYLELRNINNLKTSNTLNKSKIFVAYYINRIRLIDNF
tara:strand:- start:1354 stop:2199 length:846 start_codon:yes stop_codon:yes gene_type:complete